MALHTVVQDFGSLIDKVGSIDYITLEDSTVDIDGKIIWDFDNTNFRNAKLELTAITNTSLTGALLKIIKMPSGSMANLVVRNSADGNAVFNIENQYKLMPFPLLNPLSNSLTALSLMKYANLIVVGSNYVPIKSSLPTTYPSLVPPVSTVTGNRFLCDNGEWVEIAHEPFLTQVINDLQAKVSDIWGDFMRKTRYDIDNDGAVDRVNTVDGGDISND